MSDAFQAAVVSTTRYIILITDRTVEFNAQVWVLGGRTKVDGLPKSDRLHEAHRFDSRESAEQWIHDNARMNGHYCFTVAPC
jgi:hypothetical protein